MVVSLSEKILLLGVAQLHLLRETLQSRDVTNSLGLRGERNVFFFKFFFYLLKRNKIAKISPGPRPSWAPPASPGRCAPLPRSGPFAPAAIFIIIGILFTIKFIPCQQPQEHWEDLKEWRKSNFAKWQYFTTLVTDADVRARKSLRKEVALPYFALFLFFIP